MHFTRRRLVFLIDIVLILLAYSLACLLRYDFSFSNDMTAQFSPVIYIVFVIKPLIFISSRLYRSLWRYASLKDAMEIVKAVTIASLATIAVIALLKEVDLSRSIILLDWFLLLGFMMASRLSWRAYRENFLTPRQSSGQPTLIVGAGDAANMLLKEILRQSSSPYRLIGLVDDDPSKLNMSIMGVKVLGATADLGQIVEKHAIKKVIIAVPSAGPKFVRGLVNQCKLTGVRFRIIPGLNEILLGNVSISHVRDVEIEDLLGRSAISLDEEGIGNYLAGKRVLVSGAAGSIGSEICRQVSRYSPLMLVLLDNAETPLYHIERELAASFPNIHIVASLIDVRNLLRIEQAFDAILPEVVFHAAAYKHVPLVEQNPAEAVLCNVMGSMNMATAARHCGVLNFVQISTDKAVNPTNIMGATKRAAEKFIQSLADGSATKFSTVRFGNVLGSNGSVIPLFKEQIEKGGPLTITHPEVTRFFMTIPEASQLVLQSVCFGCGGEIFVLDMGEPVKIVDLAEELVRLSGMIPYTDIEFTYTGLRPGEKLYEELFFSGEDILKTPNEKIHVLAHGQQDHQLLRRQLEQLLSAANANNIELLISLLSEIVPEYTPTPN